MGYTPAKLPGCQPEEKDMYSGSMYQGKGDQRHLKPGQTDPSGLPAGSKGGTSKESGKEGSWNVGTGVVVNLARAGVRNWKLIRKVVA